jgi:hypothetical protein
MKVGPRFRVAPRRPISIRSAINWIAHCFSAFANSISQHLMLSRPPGREGSVPPAFFFTGNIPAANRDTARSLMRTTVNNGKLPR